MGLQWQYVGSQRLDNDQANQFAHKLAAYSLINAKVSHDYSKTVGVSLSVNNLLDKQYASYGIRSGSTGATGKYNLYPEAGRNMQGVKLIDIEGDDRVVSVAKLAEKDDGEGEAAAPPAE